MSNQTPKTDDMTNQPLKVDRISEYIGHILLAIGMAGLVATITVFGIYVLSFGSISNNQEIWGQFGDFVGGSLNSTLSFLALIALLLTLWVQTRAVKLSIIALEKSNDEILRQQKQQEDSNYKKRCYVFKLLKDEIELRWKTVMAPPLRHLETVAITDPNSAAQALVGTKMKVNDLIIFKLVGTSFSEYYFIEDASLMSKIIYAHILMCDLIDFHSTIKKALDERNSEKINEKFKSGLTSRLDNIDANFDVILSKMEP